jgi:signal transduction histidine kinase/HPt (histidine-containing phosphotransfer) domain-containing protein
MTEPESSLEARATFADRVDILYAVGRHYLSLPFAALCLPTAFFASRGPTWFTVTPLLLLLAVTIVAEQLNQAYFRYPRPGDARYWAWRYAFVSGIAGATWGIGAVMWFVPGSFPAEAYLVLAYLGMTATEFIARSAYRPAYVIHAFLSLGPLVVALLVEGGIYEILTAILIIFFAAVLFSYCNGIARLLNESVRLRRDNESLVVRFSREKREAEKSRDAAEASTRAKSVFISNISHEIRTPLNALLGMAQLLDQAELDKPYRDHVKVLLDAGRGLQTLLDDVITLSRLDGEDDSEEGCDPVQAARAVARLLQPRAWEKRLRLNLSAPAQLPHVSCDARRIRQVLLKLAENALKFTERGSVEIRIELETREHDQPFLRFSVIDTGLGVSPEIATCLFDPFTAGDQSYARVHQGAGLGLAVAKRIVDSLGGIVGFESEPGEGSTFWFSVPVSRSAPTEKAQTSLSNPPPTERTFLIHIDDPRIRIMLTNLLEPFGNRLTNAVDMADAVTRAGRDEFDAIVAAATDADTIAATPGNKTPVLAILFNGERTPAGAAATLHWPADPSELFSALRFISAARRDEIHHAQPETGTEAAIDPSAFAALEKSVGLTTLIEILQSYIKTAEDLSNALADACQQENWDEATRLAQDMAGAAGGLGLAAMTSAARGFAQKVRAGENRHELGNAAQAIVGEHLRARAALINLYPDLAA